MQNIGQTYKDYKKELPNYKAWKKQRDIRNAKKEYLFKTKPPSEEELKRAKAKADILFNAIDVMDDYSQEKAEDTETAIALAQYASQKAPSSLGLVVGGFLGLTKLPKNFWIKQFSRNKELKKEIDKTVTLPINIPFMKSNSFKLGTAISVFMTGSICASIFGLINNIFFSKLSVKCEIAASKAARFEAMQKELDDYNQFAILNDEQKNEVNKIAKNVKLSKKEKKRELTKYKTTFSMFDYLGPFKTAKELLKNAVEDNKMRENYVAYIEKEIQKNYNKDLTQEEILEAKKDKELLTSMIENIDIKSQDYAENTELITQTAGLIMSIVSALVITPLVAKVVSKTKNFLLQAVVSPLSSILLIVLPMLYFANIQKLSSKIARYKVIEEMKQNPANFVYYSDEEINSVDESKINVKKEEKDNIFKFIPKIIKEYKEYKRYVKENDEKDKKYNKALKQIEISKEQEKEAAKFQRNTFLTFNKIDDNSQKYSENVEAHWEIVSNAISSSIQLVSTLISLPILLDLTNGIKMDKNNKFKLSTKDKLNLGSIVVTTVTSLLSPLICENISTQQQKQASRVANYKAIEDLKDYQNFA